MNYERIKIWQEEVVVYLKVLILNFWQTTWRPREIRI